MGDSSGAAFPIADRMHVHPEKGLTKREWFAGCALAALAGHKAVATRGTDWLVEHAYLIADKMVAAGKQR